MSENISGAPIRSKITNDDAYQSNWDRIFGNKNSDSPLGGHASQQLTEVVYAKAPESLLTTHSMVKVELTRLKLHINSLIAPQANPAETSKSQVELELILSRLQALRYDLNLTEHPNA